MSPGDRRLLALLGLPTLGTALSATIVAAFVPVLLDRLSGPLVAGGFIALEGLFALIVAGPVGALSDRRRSRLPFLIVAAPVAAAALVALPFLDSLWAIGLALAVFFAAYYVFFAPYMALYPDLVPEHLRGRSQGSLGLWREIGLGGALVGGGLLLAAWRPLPFVLSAAVLLAVTAVFVAGVRERSRRLERSRRGHARTSGPVRLWRRRPDIRRVLVANALWETALDALRAFIVLFFLKGLDKTESFASLAFAGVAIAAVVGAPAAGILADRFGQLRVMRLSLWVYAAAMLVPLFTQSLWVLVAVVPGVLAAVVVMTLPFGLLMERLEDADHGAAAGLFATSRGVGLIAGPLLAGLAIQLSAPVLEGTEGYAAIFGVASLALLASIPVVYTLRAPPRGAARRVRTA